MENKVIQQIRNLFAGADERDWQKVAATMNDTVLLDYSSMTGAAASHLSPDDIIASWDAFLPGFDSTHHQLSDFAVTLGEDGADARYAGKADHFLNNDVWVVEGTYDTKLKLENGTWLITQQKFNFIRQSGNTSLPALATSNAKQRKK